MKDRKPEVETELAVRRWALRRGFLSLKVKFMESGYPDRLFISPYGHTIFIEFKRPGEIPEPLQAYRLAQLQGRGIPALWSDNELECIGILKAALEPSSVSGEGDKTTTEPSGGRIILGPGVGENVHCIGSDQDPIGQEIGKEDIDYSAATAMLQSLARRDREVARLLAPALDYFARSGQGT